MPTDDLEKALSILAWTHPPYRDTGSDFLSFIGVIAQHDVPAVQSRIMDFNARDGAYSSLYFFTSDTPDEQGEVAFTLSGTILLDVEPSERDRQLTIYHQWVNPDADTPRIVFTPTRGLIRVDTEQTIHPDLGAIYAVMPFLRNKGVPAEQWIQIPDYQEFYFRVAREKTYALMSYYDEELQAVYTSEAPLDTLRIASSLEEGETLSLLQSLHVGQQGLNAAVQALIRNHAEAEMLPMTRKAAGFDASIDYRVVRYRGAEYHFNSRQAQVVEALLSAFNSGMPDVHQYTLFADILDSDKRRLRDLYKTSPAWGTLIIPGGKRGFFRLNL